MEFVLPGYVSFGLILETLRQNRLSIPDVILKLLATSPTSELACTPIVVLLEPRLTSGDLEAVGVDYDGHLYWVPPQAWRRSVLDNNPRQRGQMINACLGALYTGKAGVRTGKHNLTRDCQVYLPLESFEAVFHVSLPAAEFPVIQPERLPSYSSNTNTRQTSETTELVSPSTDQHPVSTSSDATASWMKGYAKGFVDCGKKAKREDAIKVCMEVLSCTYAIAEMAYEALPYPDLRNPPRTSKPSGY